MKRPITTLGLLAALFAGCAGENEGARTAATPGASPASSDWVARSNENAKVLLAVAAKVLPERASRVGVDGLDDRIIDLAPGHRDRERAATADALAVLRARHDRQTHPLVKQDLAILVHAADLELRQLDAEEKYEVPYTNVTRFVFLSVMALLDDQIPEGRRGAALIRVRKYAGLEGGQKPLAELARAETMKALERPDLMRPSRLEIEHDLAKNGFMRDGIAKLFGKYDISGYEDAVRALTEQLAAYDAWVKDELLPKARDTFALAPPIYELALERLGVDMPPSELTKLAHAAFTEIQGEMQKVAAVVAAERHLPSSDYRDVIHALKQEPLGEDVILAHYKQRLADIEAIIRREKLITLPARPARIRLGTPAENAEQPAPHMKPPRMLGNKGEQGEFVLPLSAPGESDREAKPDDFTYAAASWTLTAHEARPGHELQFSSMIEHGVSTARMVYAFNSTNVEGWGLYAEHITLPFMPADGKLVSLQLRLQRAARAFLDPELQQGKWTPEAARAFLEKEVAVSPALARSEVDRYTFKMPGQATTYFYGYTKLLALRREVEARMGARFDAQRFHDFVLAQGLLPPGLMREAVMRGFAGG